jgi:hypothetical protein
MAYQDNLKQYRHFPIRQWLSENDDLLDSQWHEIPRNYPYDPSRTFRQRYTRVPEREGLFEYRATCTPYKHRVDATGAPLKRWRAEVRYVWGTEYDDLFDKIYGD